MEDEEDCGKLRDVLSPGQDNGVGVNEALKKFPMGYLNQQRAQG